MDRRPRGPERDLEGWRSFLSWREREERDGMERREKRVNILSLYFAQCMLRDGETGAGLGYVISTGESPSHYTQ